MVEKKVQKIKCFFVVRRCKIYLLNNVSVSNCKNTVNGENVFYIIVLLMGLQIRLFKKI